MGPADSYGPNQTLWAEPKTVGRTKCGGPNQKRWDEPNSVGRAKLSGPSQNDVGKAAWYGPSHNGPNQISSVLSQVGRSKQIETNPKEYALIFSARHQI